MITIGHRGACGHEPENTIASIKKALELGVDMVEFDVQKTMTGEVVLMHDDRIDRTTNGKGELMEMSFENLRKLDAGKGEQIPTLQEALDAIGKQAKASIELKGPDTALPVSEIISEYLEQKEWQEENFLVSSFEWDELEKFHLAMPRIKLGLLVGRRFFAKISRKKFLAKAKKLGAVSVHLRLNYVSKRDVTVAHENNLKIYVYTANEIKDINKLNELGVDGIFSNFPDRIKQGAD